MSQGSALGKHFEKEEGLRSQNEFRKGGEPFCGQCCKKNRHAKGKRRARKKIRTKLKSQMNGDGKSS